jgi:hypothetical protein
MSDIQSTLTDDEAAVLDIAAQSGNIAAIGRWEAPVKSLLKRGFLSDQSGDTFNCIITEAGAAARAGQEAEDDRALGRQIDALRTAAIAQKSIQEMAEQCAQVLSQIAKISSKVSGMNPVIEAKKWGDIVIDRASDLLR